MRGIHSFTILYKPHRCRPKYFLQQSKLVYANEKWWASILYFYSCIRCVNEASGWQNFTASLLPNRMHSSHFVFANVLTISITLTSFPSHDFSKLRHSVESLILREKGEQKPPTLNKPPKPNPTMDFSALYLLDQKRHRQKIIAFLPFILPPPTLLWCSLHKFPSSFGSTLSYIRYK